MDLAKAAVTDVTRDEWYGFQRHCFKLNGHEAWIVEPPKALPGNPWAWCMEWPTAFVERIGVCELVAKGFHYVHVNIFGTYASEEGLRILDQFHDMLQALKFAEKASLVGLSMGGFYAYRWAARNPEKVAAIYGDAPVCHVITFLKAGSWENVKKAYGMNDEELLAFDGNPIDNLTGLAANRVPLLHVVGDADEVVPVGFNTEILERRYRKLGGSIRVLHRPYVGHHPHGYDNPSEAVEFLLVHRG